MASARAFSTSSVGHAFVGQLAELGGDHLDGLVGARQIDARLRDERARVGVRAVDAVDEVRKASALAHLEEEARRHPGAEHRGKHLHRVPIGVPHRVRRDPQADVGLVGILLVDVQLRLARPGELCGHRLAGAVPGHVAEQILETRDQTVADRPGDAHDQACRCVPVVEVVEERLAGRAANRLARSQRLPAERVRAEDELFVQRADVVARRVDVHVHLLDDDALLAVDLFTVELRVAQHVDEYVQGPVAVLARAADVVARVLLRGERVELAAHLVDLHGEIACGRPALGPLEEHVLGEMRDASIRGVLVARAGGEHDVAGDRFGMVERRGDHPEAVRERVSLEDGHAAMV